MTHDDQTPISPAISILSARDQLDERLRMLHEHLPLDLVAEQRRLAAKYVREKAQIEGFSGALCVIALMWVFLGSQVTLTHVLVGLAAAGALILLVLKAPHPAARYAPGYADWARKRAERAVRAMEANDEQYRLVREIRQRRPDVSWVLGRWLSERGGRRSRKDCEYILEIERLYCLVETLEAGHLEPAEAEAVDAAGLLRDVVRLQTVDELLAFMRAAPRDRWIEATGTLMVTHSRVWEGVHGRESNLLAVVPEGSPAAAMLMQAWEAAGHGPFAPGDQSLWESLPVRYGPWGYTWVLPEHPKAHKTWAANKGGNAPARGRDHRMEQSLQASNHQA